MLSPSLLASFTIFEASLLALAMVLHNFGSLTLLHHFGYGKSYCQPHYDRYNDQYDIIHVVFVFSLKKKPTLSEVLYKLQITGLGLTG